MEMKFVYLDSYEAFNEMIKCKGWLSIGFMMLINR